MAGASAAIGLYGFARIGTTVMQGTTVVMPQTDFMYAAAACAGAALVVVSLGYWTGSMLAALMGRQPGAGSSRDGRRLTIATLVAIPIVSLAFGAWLRTTPVVLDVTANEGAVHRLTVSETSLQLDAASIPSGKVTFLVTVDGHPPPGLSLLDVSRSVEHWVGTPPSGSVDWVLARIKLSPGPWEFRLAGMMAKFEVTP